MSAGGTQNQGRRKPDPWDLGFGAVVLAAALLALFVWFPADIRGGFYHVNAIGKTEPGDAFFPVLLAVTLAVLSGVQLLLSLLRGAPATGGRLTARNLRFLATFVAICGLGLLIMYALGPVTVWLLRELGLLDAQYRNLTDTAPYKYLGYLAGGFLMTLALIAWTEGRIRLVAVITVLAVQAVAILIFDGLLTNVLLPPNAEF